MQVLVVEDNADNRQLVTWILEDANMHPTCVGSAEEGLALLAEKSFDLVLMDISLPGMDGKEATQQIRCTPEISEVPVIALTAHGVQAEQDAILASGVNDIATKPIDESALLTQIEQYVPR